MWSQLPCWKSLAVFAGLSSRRSRVQIPYRALENFCRKVATSGKQSLANKEGDGWFSVR